MTELMEIQIADLKAVHKGLVDLNQHEAETILSGTMPFEASYDGLETIADTFDIELAIPNDFPERLPRVKETGGQISADYDHLNSGGTLCLAVPIEQRRVFLEEPTLLGFVNRLVIPYLYGYCYFRRHGHHPFKEAAHGYEGIFQHYIDSLGLDDDLSALRVISFLIEHGYRGHHDCPCGSGRRVRTCHGPKLLKLHQTHTADTLWGDFNAIFAICFTKFQNGELSISMPLLNQLRRVVKKFPKKLQ